jgi:phosphatidylserine decarboxylase
MGGHRLPIASDGTPFILVPLGLGAGLWWLGWSGLGIPLLVVSGFMVWFFRDPERVAPEVKGAILAPADGRVVEAGARVDDPFVGAAQQVSIFLSPLDVHVNRAPIGGLVVSVDHRAGVFLPAYRPEASERNERTILAIQGESARVVVRQIAGILARRIVCRARAGDKLEPGQRFGMIKFGSRTDVVFPPGARLSVRRGDRVRAGETVLAVGE